MTREVIPTEADEARTLVAWLRVKGIRFSHSPNETGHSMEARRRAIRMKQQGTSRGFPDYCVIVKSGVIFIELKRRVGGRVSPEQQQWLDDLNQAGVPAYVARGAEEAITLVSRHL